MAADVRVANRDDEAAVAAAMAHAFHDDPVMAWLFGGSGERTHARRQRFFRWGASLHLRHGTSYTTDGDVVGASLWDPPGHWKTSFTAILRNAPNMLRDMGPRGPRALRGLSTVEKRHPAELHYYLAVLGTHPDHQGRGIGAALLAPVLDRCDDEGLGAYLESSKEQNVPYYRRFGFEVTYETELPGGPTVWGMWRDPKGPAA